MHAQISIATTTLHVMYEFGSLNGFTDKKHHSLPIVTEIDHKFYNCISFLKVKFIQRSHKSEAVITGHAQDKFICRQDQFGQN